MSSDPTLHKLPPIHALSGTVEGCLIQQIHVADDEIAATSEEFVHGRLRGHLLRPVATPDAPILVLPSNADIPVEYEYVLVERQSRRKGQPTHTSYTWARHSKLGEMPTEPIDYEERCRSVITSWKGAFSYRQEDTEGGISGLRSPQIGAVHAIHGHWTTSRQIATVVMPTGTGKTETMLSVLLSKGCSRVLVIVPTDALRTQIAEKFLSLGILKRNKVIQDTALHPIVGTLKHRPRTPEEVDTIFSKCNVVVTTAQIAGQCTDEVQARMAHWCPFLFIDEAHHIAASTWHAFREKFEHGHILQFTATPFRNDGKLLGGKIIYNFPLRLALELEYFRKITFKPVIEYDRRRADEAIAAKSIEQLRSDLESYDHILMARVESIDRAGEVHEIYARLAPDLNPVQIHTGISSKRERDEIRRQIISKEARIVVCVDMLGEGFDLPELKIAAFHDIKKSLPVTLQLAGRFTRSKAALGDPTFIANIGIVEVRNELRRLYSQDPDWNALLMQASEEVIDDQITFQEFVEGFRNFPEELALQNMRPAMSTVVYRTTCEDWNPENFRAGLPGIENIERIHSDINHDKKTMVIVTARKLPIDWAQIQEIFNWHWELYVIHWNDAQNLLFINCSGNDGHYQKLAAAVAGNVSLINGPPVFRCFAGVNRLKLQNVGLLEQLGKLIRFIMRAGGDVEAALTEAQRRNTRKSNIFGNGYENGHKTSIGCSYKGRIWSQRVANVESLVRWCNHVGRKVLDETIDPDDVLRGTLTPVPVSERPNKMPIGIEWPETMYQETETAYEFFFGEELTLPWYLVELRLTEPALDGDITFELVAEGLSARYRLRLFEEDGVNDFQVVSVDGRTVYIRKGAGRMRLDEFLYKFSPRIWFADGSSLDGNLLTELKRKHPPYSVDRISAWDWIGVNITKESQKIEKRTDSIQYRVIQELMARDYSVIVDDDDPGEAADVVAVKVNPKNIEVDLFHCKYSSEPRPGGRVGDLYEVCGQAQKSIRWMEEPSELFRHLLRRDSQRAARGAGRLEKGTREELMTLVEMSILRPISLRIHIVQPGLSKREASLEQLELLSVTENYLMETYMLPFIIIASS
jgi:superfamily II DNA or RNA helicase